MARVASTGEGHSKMVEAVAQGEVTIARVGLMSDGRPLKGSIFAPATIVNT